MQKEIWIVNLRSNKEELKRWKVKIDKYIYPNVKQSKCNLRIPEGFLIYIVSQENEKRV